MHHSRAHTLNKKTEGMRTRSTHKETQSRPPWRNYWRKSQDIEERPQTERTRSHKENRKRPERDEDA